LKTGKQNKTVVRDEIGILRDELNKLKKKLKLAEKQKEEFDQTLEFYKNMINSLDDPFFVKNEQHRWVFLNDAACKLWHYRREDLIGKTDYDIFPKEEADVYWKKDNVVFESEKVDLNEEKQTIDGKVYTISTKKSIHKDSKTGEKYVVGSIRDITKQKGAEEALRREKDRAQRYLDIAGVMLVAIDADQRVTLINRKGCEILGYGEYEIIGKNWFDVVLPDDLREEVRSIYQRMIGGDARLLHYYENPVVTKDKKTRMIAWHNTIITTKNGKILGTLSSGEDITERKDLEEQLYQSQKMEAIGRLAGGIAHDFNNLLTAIIGYSEILSKDTEVTPKNQNYIEEIKKSGQRAATLTQQLLAFSRRQILQPKVLNLNTLLKSTRDMLYRLIGEHIDIELSLASEIGMIRADPGKIEQVIINLSVNARDAMLLGGKLSVETRNVRLDDAYCKLHKGTRPGNYVLLQVRDTGKGIEPETMKHLFEPFYTTKDIGKGTGLGLATVYGIVRQSGGYIDVQSKMGSGTSVEIYLAQVDEKKAAQKIEYVSHATTGGSETILFVEDDDMVRNMVTAILAEFGYQVIEAENGTEAMKASQGEKKINLMITDVVMPGISGPDLVKKITVQHPDMKVLFISGYTDDAIVNHGFLDENTPFLQKPFTPNTLALKVRELLMN
jgi:PAS domain S-box-containing protein